MEFKLSWINAEHYKISMGGRDVAILSCKEWRIVSLISGSDITPWNNGEVSDVVAATKVIEKLSHDVFMIANRDELMGVVRVKTKLGFVLYLARKAVISGGYYLTTDRTKAVIKSRSDVMLIASALKDTKNLPLADDDISAVHHIISKESIIKEELITRT